MDLLSDLPAVETQQPPREKSLMMKYFGASENGSTNSDSGAKTGSGWGRDLKVSLVTSLLFLILANPFTDRLIASIPYVGGNSIGVIASKFLIFFIVFMLIYRYLL